MRRQLGVGALAAAVALIGATEASAAVTIGSTFPANTLCSSTNPVLAAQTTSPAGTPYRAPSDGVITSWSHHSVPSSVGAGPIKLKVIRLVAANFYSVVGESAVLNPSPGLNTAPTRVPVKADDALGLMAIGVTNCFIGMSGLQVHGTTSDHPPGDIDMFGTIDNVLLDVAATIEPDADEDGYGDETQDGCLGDESDHGDCVAPDTTITGGPKAKTRSKKAIVDFASSEGGSSFRCSLDGNPFETCTSPQELRVGRGKHAFVVIAKDGAGNVDETPAVLKWTVKKKRKRR
jgi:hypothetical protein